MAGLPNRILAHRIDTLAVRRFEGSLSENWVVRDTIERDYGIDLTLEYFDGKTPTGQIIFIQVKGTASPIKPQKGTVGFSLKVSTLRYSELFSVPFFLVVVPLDKAQPMYFCHLQKYISMVLDVTDENWRNQQKKTILIPEVNKFEENMDKFESIVNSESFHHETVKFISAYWLWEFHLQHVKGYDDNHVEGCISALKKIIRLDGLLKHSPHISKAEIKTAIKELEGYDGNEESTIAHIEAFHDECVEPAHTRIVAKEEIEKFIAEETGESPY